MEDGFPEAFLRGLRSTFLNELHYASLKEGGSRGVKGGGREDFEDIKLVLQETDYETFLGSEVCFSLPRSLPTLRLSRVFVFHERVLKHGFLMYSI